MRRFLPFLFCCCVSLPLFSQTPADLAVPLTVAAGINPPGVLVNWANPQPSDIQLRRRTKGASGNAWTVLLEESLTVRDGYYDTTGLAANATYEYALSRKTGSLQAYGYAYAAIAAPVVDDRGKLLVFVDSASADALGADLVNFKNDLRGEGWQIIPFHTGPFTTVQGLKNQIVSLYNADPGHVKAVLLIGDVPVPYSGSLAKDNRPDHVGAWPCDAYYGDVDGVWTDNTVNLPNTARTANRNVPGDGKFDQNALPSAVEIPIGRLDFRHLSAATFGLPPVELLRRYFIKNHRWRTGQFEVPNQALVDDDLGWSGGAAFAADGFRNAYPLVGSNSVTAGDFLTPGSPQRYLLGYGAGLNGSYNSAGGIGTATDFASDSINMVVANLYGDYFGDWDAETNPLLPALLASKGAVLACGWAGRPSWLLQGLATGETIGYCLKETQNAQYNDAYGHFTGESGTQVALLGDPTLRVKIVKPAANLSAVSNCTHVDLHWTASPDPEVLGYLVYRAFDQNGPYTRLTQNAVTGTSWSDPNPVADTLYYSVRAMKWEVTPGGGNFYNTSTGVLKSVIFQPGTGPTVIGLGGALNCTVTSLTLGAHFTPNSVTVQWIKPNGNLLNGFTATEAGVYTVIATAPNGCTAVAYASVTVDTFLPEPGFPTTILLDCIHPTAPPLIVPDAPDGVHYTWDGLPVVPGTSLSLAVNSPVFVVSSSNNGCSKAYPIQLILDTAAPAVTASTDGQNLDCIHSFVQLFGSSSTPNVQFAWAGSGETYFEPNPIVLLPGEYCLTVTGTNGCSASSCVQVTATGEEVSSTITFDGNGPCSDGNATELGVDVFGGTAPFQFLWSNGSTAQSTVFPAGFTGTVALTVTDAHGCVGNASATIALPITILVSKSNPSSSGAADGSIDLLVTGGVAPYSFQWSNGSTEQDLDNLPNGTYAVTMTDAAGCSSTLSVSLLTVGTNTPAGEPSIRIAPNPAATTVGVYLTEKESVRLRLTDLAGRTITVQDGTDSSFFLDISLLNSGLYLLWVELPTGRRSYKLVVEH